MRARRRYGFTLIEAMFTLAIFSLVLYALAHSLGMLARVGLSRQDFGIELEVLQVSQLIRNDARNAAQATVSTDTVTFVGQNPELSLATRLAQGLDSDSSKATVVFNFRDGWLYRTVTDSSGSRSAPVCKLESFVASQDGSLARLEMETILQSKGRTFEAVVQLP